MPGPTLISALPIADPLDGTEDVPVVQHGITKQSKSSDFWSGGTLVPTASPFFTGTIGGTADFSAVLSKATGSSTSRTLAARFSDVINVLDWGAVADCTAVGVGTNNTTAFSNALAYAKAQGKNLYIPAGKYRLAGALAIDVSAYTSILASPALPSIVGDGARATILVWDNGVITGLTVTGSWTGSETIGSFSISGLCLYKGDGAGTGLSLNVLVHAHIKDVISLQWNNGCLCVDVLSSEFDNCQFMYNLHGLGATRSTQSEPNAISFLGCEFGGNQNWGLSVKGGSTLTVTGGSIESNGGVGVEASQFGVQVVASATDPQEGSAGATFNSVYFERNAGFGDIYFANSAWNSTLTVVGCTFNRGDPMSTGALGTNCIRLEVFGASAVTRVSLIGNGFKGLGSYTASSARPYIGVVNAGQPLFIYDVGCHYDSSLEAPPSGTFSGFAPLASPTFTGTPAAPTATSGTNTTQLATTAFVQTAISGSSGVSLAVSGTDPVPLVDGTAAVGTSAKASREDHVHPTDSTRAPLASPTFTGTVTIPAGASISGFATLASPTFTGTPAAPTAVAGTNTTQLSTTAYVVAALASYLTSATASSTYEAIASLAADVRAVVLTGLSTATSTAIAATDSILVALGKLQAQVTLRAPLASPTFTGTVTIPAGASISGFAPLASPSFTGTIAGTADFSGILAKPSGTGSVTRSLTALLADVIDVKNFGAVGNGSTDDTAAINAAIATVAAVGGIVFFPAGTYKITSAISITAASVHLRGAGTHSTQIMQATSSASVFTVSGTDAQIEHMLIGYSVTPGTTVVALDTSSTYGRFNHLTVYNVAHGIRASASASCQFFSFITVLTATGSCFWVDGGTDIQISHFLFLPGGSDNTASTWATAGAFRVSGFVEGLVAHAGEVFGGLYSLAMSGTTLARGSCPAFNNFTDVFFDSSASYGVSLTNVMDTEFVGCWIACGRFTGAAQPGANLSSTSGIRFANCKFIACGSHGMVLSTGATHTSVQTCTFDSNGGYVTAGTAAGVAVAANVNNFTVAGSRFSNGIIAGPVGGTQQNGVVVSSGTSNHYRIESNIFDASLGGAGVVDAGSGTDKQIETAIGNRGAMTATDLTLTTDASQTALAGAWTQTTPAIAPASGTFTTAGATLRYKKIGRTVMFSLHGLITTPGTGSGGVNVTMPFAPAWDSCFAGRETAVTGKVVTGELFISSTTFAINYGDNTSIIAANAAFTINGAYEAAS